jgi:hypothetical protein
MNAYVSRDIGNFAMIPESLIFSGLSDKALRMYAALSRYADKGGTAYPARATLAERMQWSESTVDRALRDLVKAGLLRVTLRVKNVAGEVREGKQGAGWEPTSSLYQLVTPASPVTAPSPTAPMVPSVSSDGAQRLQRRPIHSHLNESHLNETTRTRSTPAPGSFQAWYDSYPRRIGKQAALTAYRRACKLTSEEELLLALKRQLPDLISRDPKYIPHPATWLNQQRWADEPPRKKHWADEIA